MHAIEALQKMDDRSLRVLLLAVIQNQEEQVAVVATRLKVEPQVMNYLTIAEAASRWLKSLPN
jgi:hypothetical protein